MSKVKCYSCGKEIDSNSNFCIYCGSKIKNNEGLLSKLRTLFSLNKTPKQIYFKFNAIPVKTYISILFWEVDGN